MVEYTLNLRKMCGSGKIYSTRKSATRAERKANFFFRQYGWLIMLTPPTACFFGFLAGRSQSGVRCQPLRTGYLPSLSPGRRRSLRNQARGSGALRPYSVRTPQCTRSSAPCGADAGGRHETCLRGRRCPPDGGLAVLSVDSQRRLRRTCFVKPSDRPGGRGVGLLGPSPPRRARATRV